MIKLSYILTITALSLTSCSKYKETEFGKTVIKDFSVADTLEKGNSQELEVVILSGQSNATGIGDKNILKTKTSDEEYKVYEDGFSNVLINYFVDNGINRSNEFVITKIGQGLTTGNFGPELELAKKLSEDESKKYVILKYSYSGTCLYGQWYD
ncbi:MAG: hypothetical protein HUJ61_01120, partial [Bacilli bacterium]|nr:hypothetical protein [Bacilli bacterium]